MRPADVGHKARVGEERWIAGESAIRRKVPTSDLLASVRSGVHLPGRVSRGISRGDAPTVVSVNACANDLVNSPAPAHCLSPAVAQIHRLVYRVLSLREQCVLQYLECAAPEKQQSRMIRVSACSGWEIAGVGAVGDERWNINDLHAGVREARLIEVGGNEVVTLVFDVVAVAV